MTQSMQLGLFFASVAAIVVCGCIFTLKLTKKLRMDSLTAAVSDEHQPGCFALEEDGNWMGSGVPVIKEARPSL